MCICHPGCHAYVQFSAMRNSRRGPRGNRSCPGTEISDALTRHPQPTLPTHRQDGHSCGVLRWSYSSSFSVSKSTLARLCSVMPASLHFFTPRQSNATLLQASIAPSHHCTNVFLRTKSIMGRLSDNGPATIDDLARQLKIKVGVAKRWVDSAKSESVWERDEQ